MNSKLVLAAVLGGLVVYVFTSISWMVLPFHSATIHELPNGDALSQALKESVTESGLYHYPGMGTPDMEDRFAAGPNISFLIFQPNGSEMGAGMFIWGLILNIVSAFIASWMLLKSVAAYPGYMQRVAFFTMLGVFVSLSSYMLEWNWWGFPLAYTLAMIFDVVVGWGLAGLVAAKFITPESAKA